MVFSSILINNKEIQNNNNNSNEFIGHTPLATNGSWSVLFNNSNFSGSGYKGSELQISKDGRRMIYFNQTDGSGKAYYYKYTGATLDDTNGSWVQVDMIPSNYTSARGNEPERLGSYMAMSDDGNVVSLCAPIWTQFQGRVVVYEVNDVLNPTSLIQKGQVIENSNRHTQNTTTGGSQFAYNTLSHDGNILAIAELYHTTSIIALGRIIIYNYESNSWVLKTSILNPAGSSWGNFGRELCFSKYADVLAAGSRGHSDNRVTIWRRNGTSWTYNLEYTITGEHSNGLAGHEVAISDDGTIVAQSEITANGNKGQVRIHKYDGSSWNQMGNDIEGSQNGFNNGSVNYFGQAIALSSAGKILSTGSGHYHNNGVNYVGGFRAFQYNDTNNTWEQIGNLVVGTNAKETAANAQKMTSDGRFLFCAFKEYNEIRIYKYI